MPHLSRPELVPAGRVSELGWPWGLCTVAVKGSYFGAGSLSLSPGALSRDSVAGVRELLLLGVLQDQHGVHSSPKDQAQLYSSFLCPWRPQVPSRLRE